MLLQPIELSVFCAGLHCGFPRSDPRGLPATPHCRLGARRAPRKLDPSGTFPEAASGRRGMCGSLWGGSSLKSSPGRCVVAAPDGRTPGKVGKEQATLGFHRVLCGHRWISSTKRFQGNRLTRWASALKLGTAVECACWSWGSG